MLGIKRRRSRSADKPRKSQKVLPANPHLDNEEDLQTILKKIREQEEREEQDSEALARKLQQEFDALPDGKENNHTEHREDAPSASGHAGPSMISDDEAFARRLALEWEQLDAAESVPLTSSSNPIDGGISYSAISNTQPAKSFQPAPAFLTRVTDPEEALLKYSEVFTQSRNCTKCNKSVASPRGRVVFSPALPPFTLLALLHATCDSCGQSHCRGCFRPIACPISCKGRDCSVSSCCAEVRAIALFEALGGFDMQYIVEQEYSVNRGRTTSRPEKASSVGPGGTGYSTGSWDHGHPSGHSSNRRGKQEDPTVAAAREAVAARWDDIIRRALDTIAYFLPSPYVENAASFDLLPHPSIQCLLFMSFLPELLGGLLINDSVNDWTARSDVYNSLLKLLRRMADSELSVRVLVGERWAKKKSVGLENWMWGDGTVEWERNPTTKEVVRAPPLYDHFRTLIKQCQIFQVGALRLLETGDDSVVEDLTLRATSLCGDMISTQEDIQRALSVITKFDSPEQPEQPSDRKEKGKDKDPKVDMEKEYCAAWEDLAFMHIPLSNDSPDGTRYYPYYHFARLVTDTENSTRQPAKRFHLIKELSATSTSLPPGVWVRVDEVRNDVIKMMIAGPEGTPYAGGLFEFHCFLPLEFPDRPPQMFLATTGRGTVRFNPNLYADGKVCLSLLGTWPGSPEEQWSPKSTLLQVLVSIQSMILVEAPYFNEPGMGQVNMENRQSIEYNMEASRNTILWAMVDWMKEEHRNSIWKDVIATHFSIRKQKIRECINTWAKTDPSILNYQKRYKRSGGSYLSRHDPYNALGADSNQESGRDLLCEFDRGCERVGGWIARDARVTNPSVDS